MTEQSKRQRDHGVDILRGVAIVTMFGANIAGFVLQAPHPMALRLYGTFAAPMFIALAGAMVFKTAIVRPERGFGYYAKRGAAVMFYGVVIDVAFFRVVPFLYVDVLYLIGVSIPIAWVGAQLPLRWRTLTAVFFLGGALVLQRLLGYSELPLNLYLTDPNILTQISEGSVWQHWLVDGYFPIFPWAGFAILGGIFGELRWGLTESATKQKTFALTALAVLLVGSCTWFLHPGPLLTREGYSELFYPPTLGYMLTAIGLTGLLFFTSDAIARIRALSFLSLYGKSSMLMYFLQWALVTTAYAALPVIRETSLDIYIGVYVAISLTLLLVAWMNERRKKRWRPRHVLLSVLFGG